eukprot:175508_1
MATAFITYYIMLYFEQFGKSDDEVFHLFSEGIEEQVTPNKSEENRKIMQQRKEKMQKKKDEKNSDTAISIKIEQERLSDIHKKKILILGTRSSGKSTLIQSLKNSLQDQSDIKSDTTVFTHTIRQKCVSGILMLLKKSREFYDYDDEIASAIQLVVDYGSESFHEVLDYNEVSELGKAIYMLWKLDAVQKTFDTCVNTCRYLLPENMNLKHSDHFFGKVREIMLENYTPSVEDSLKCTVQPNGMIEYKYYIKDNEYILYDVSGLRNQYKKWLH